MSNKIRVWWDKIGAGWKWLLSIIGAGIVSYSLNLIFEGKILSWIWKLLGNFVDLLIIHWMTLVPLLFGMLFAILIALLYYFKFYRFKKYIATSLENNFRKDLRSINDKISHLESYVSMVFEDDFTTDLQKNWHYKGKWDLVPGGGLSVTQSEKGGITRVGQLWTDYSFEFTAVIATTVEEHQCIGWIVRAQDLSNYYMIQLNPAEVRPHFRVGGRWITAPQKKYGYAIDKARFKLSIKPKEPTKILTEVRGSEIRVYVKGKEIYHEQKFFSMRFINKEFEDVAMQPGVLVVPPFATGRVGFRMHGQERGGFYMCRVRPLQQETR